MAQQGAHLFLETISCPICLDSMRDAVTIPCGHSYCRKCIQGFWDEDNQRDPSCPQCRQTFTPKPALKKNTMLADLVEKLQKTGLQAAPADHCYAGPEDVACDFCSGRKLRALKSCLMCLASYCEKHLQPHYESSTFKNHKLVQPSKNLQENICSHHQEVMKMFCRTDQQCICYLCSLDEHKGHDVVPVTEERSEWQRRVETSLQVQHQIQVSNKDLKLLQQEVEKIRRSADKAVQDSERIFTQLIRLMKKRRSNVTQQIRSQQQAEESRVEELQETLEEVITDLRRKEADLDQLSRTEDHNYFLQNYSSLSSLHEATELPSIKICPVEDYKNFTMAVSEISDSLQEILSDEWMMSLRQTEPETRDGLLKYTQQITLDLNTAHRRLKLSEGNRRVSCVFEMQSYPTHPDRFTAYRQVLSSQGLTGRCYWEVEFVTRGISIAVASKTIERSGTKSGFGYNDKSWSLECYSDRYEFRHNRTVTPVSGPKSSTVGVYLDHSAGILSSYSVSDTVTLLHRVQTTFTEPLHVGLWLYRSGPYLHYLTRTAEIRQLM
ncbi:tripartite motif-containing protein 16-like [Thalassophryne amazonica]|uniref:tripartite motif-containing protein 16-like n=1 Tax=Thalassophryne amazonica TaxID=390379 RepID=UPI00147165E3|nr:tripartite motif-containing protein 16-like [Thalassophryne amazonica]